METEGIKYTGSKREVLPRLLDLIRPLNVKTVFDGFSGTTRVSQALKKAGYSVISNDIAEWSKVFGQCYLLNTKPHNYYQEKVDYLNSIKGKKGWFTEHYGGEPNGGSALGADGKKKMWQTHNTMKLDSIRDEIDKISNDEIEKSVLLTSLILAMDKVDSSVGHQVSYLKSWAPRAYKTMRMEVPQLIIDSNKHQVFKDDIFNALEKVEPDLAYYDPPYGSSNELMPPSRVRYASYYHIWKSICLNDKPKVGGAANRREDVSDLVAGSVFEEFRKNEDGKFIVIGALQKLIESTRAKYIVLSYNNNGRATLDAILDILKKLNAGCSVFEMDYKKNVMSTMKWTNEWLTEQTSIQNKEFLFFIDNTANRFEEIKFSKLDMKQRLVPAQQELALF